MLNRRTFLAALAAIAVVGQANGIDMENDLQIKPLRAWCRRHQLLRPITFVLGLDKTICMVTILRT